MPRKKLTPEYAISHNNTQDAMLDDETKNIILSW